MDMKNATLGQLQYLSQQHTEYRKQALQELGERMLKNEIHNRGKGFHDRMASYDRVQQGILFKDEG